jgi:hypothetical protein
MVKTIWDFDIFDFLAYIVPGAIALLLLYPLIPTDITSDLLNLDSTFSTILLLFITLISYFIGHIGGQISNWLRRSGESFFNYHMYFDKFLEDIIPNEGNSDEGGVDNHIQYEFFCRAAEQLGLKDEEINIEDMSEKKSKELKQFFDSLYRASKSYLYAHEKDTQIRRIDKFQSLYGAFDSIFIFLLLFSIFYSLWTLFSGPVFRSLQFTLVIIGMLLFLSFCSRSLSKKYRKLHAKCLIEDFYTSFLIDDTS